jgi:hypothetical protein
MGSAPVEPVAESRESLAAICWLYSFTDLFAVPQ